MNDRSPVNDRMTDEPLRRERPVRHFLAILGMLLLIAYLAIFLACRTKGFQTYAEAALQRRLGLPVSLKSAQATPALNLRLEGLASRNSDQAGRPAIRIREAVVGWSWAGWIRPGGRAVDRLTLRGCSISFAPGASGRWEPLAFERLGRWLSDWGGFGLTNAPTAGGVEEEEAGDAPAPEKRTGLMAPDFWDRVHLEVQEGRIVWWDAQGRELAAAEGIELTVTPIRLPRRQMVHYALSIEDARIGPDRRLHQFAIELLNTGDQQIVLALSGDWRGRGRPERAAVQEAP